MRVVVQKVKEASVAINDQTMNAIQRGLLIFLGITIDDDAGDVEYLCRKITQLRIFEDGNNKMNLSIQDIKGDLLIISQFTLYASTKKGNRPSFILAAKPEISQPLYDHFIKTISNLLPGKIKTGTFGADMKVSLINDGPVTLIIDSKEKA